MHRGWNPTRRNRNIGTARQGHGQDNRLVIPNPGWDYRPFWSRLGRYRTVHRHLLGHPFRVVVEEALPEYLHCSTVDDILTVLQYIPAPDREDLGLVILRQPRRKEGTLSPCWGRLAYLVEIDDYRGPAVILEAIRPGTSIRWSHSLDPDRAQELTRLRADGHTVHTTKRAHLIETSAESARATQLYRTLPHEVGHWVHYLCSVRRPARHTPFSTFSLEDRYFRKAKKEKEAFAHRYADEFHARLQSQRLLPFARLLDEASLRRDGLNGTDFGLTQ